MKKVLKKLFNEKVRRRKWWYNVVVMTSDENDILFEIRDIESRKVFYYYYWYWPIIENW